MKQFYFLFFIVLIPKISQSQLLDTTHIWPTNAGQFLSSTFGETRSAHFHAGLDIKTWGREGYKVYATRGGVISRLSITNTGYGKAIYLKHDDGTYTVYAHLQRFTSRFQQKADSVRLETYSYEMDGFFEPDEIYVRQGEVIGYTGSTGIGPPHLHYEIRNEKNEPINPLSSNLFVIDTVSPTFRSILVEPLTPTTTIEGQLLPKKFSPKRVSPGIYDAGEISVSGTVGISVNVYDGADQVYNKYAIYELILLSGSDTLFVEKLQRFNFDQADNMFLDRTKSPTSRSRSYQRLFLKDDADNPFVISHQNNVDGTFNEPYTIIARDYYGNTSTATLKFIPDIPQSIKESTPTISKLKDAYWHEDWVDFADTTYLDLKNFSYGTLWDSTINQRIIEPLVDLNTTLARINPNAKSVVTTPDYRLTTTFPERSFFDTLSILQSYTLNGDTLQIDLLPENLPIRNAFALQFYVGDFLTDSDRVNLYSYNPSSGKLSFINSQVSGNTIYASTSSFGAFRLAQDTLAPTINQPIYHRLDNGERVFSIKANDSLSGIDFTTAVFIINKERGIAEFDYENNEFTFYLPGFVPKKVNKIYFQVKDRAGNISEAIFQL